MRDGPHDRAHREHAPCKPQREGHRGFERRVGRATTGATRQAPPPPGEGRVPRHVPAPCLRRAYARGRAARTPPAPTPFSPTHPGKGRRQRGGGEGTGGGGQRTDRRARGRDRRRAVETQKNKKNKKKHRSKQTKAPGEESEKTGTKTATTGGRPGRHGPARDAGELPDLGGMGAPKGNPPPHCSLSLCLRRACVLPATCVLQREEDKGDKGDDSSGLRTPPKDNAAGWGGSGERVRDGPHDHAQREHALCKPQRGDHRGCDRRVGRATTGATRLAPPSPTEGQVPRLVPAPCSRRAYARGQAARKPPNPPPTPPPTHERGENSEKTARGHGGGQVTDQNAEGKDE